MRQGMRHRLYRIIIVVDSFHLLIPLEFAAFFSCELGPILSHGAFVSLSPSLPQLPSVTTIGIPIWDQLLSCSHSQYMSFFQLLFSFQQHFLWAHTAGSMSVRLESASSPVSCRYTVTQIIVPMFWTF